MPNAAINELELIAPGHLARKLSSTSAYLDSRLAKRYDAPFASPYPLAITRWLAHLVTRDVYLKRGVDPNDEQWAEVRENAKTAEAEIKEAAASEDGLFDLPLRANTDASGISRGGPKMRSSASPYAWIDEQKRRVIAERRTGGYTRRG